MSRFQHLQYFHEKLFAGAATLAASGVAYLGAILTDGEIRWVCITLASSMLTAMFVAVIIRSPAETMKITIGRAGFSILLGCLGTRELLIRWGITAFEHDAIRLAGAAAGMTIAGMVVGYPLLLLSNKRGRSIAKGILDKISPGGSSD